MTEDLFAHAGAEAQKAAMPLAARMRPRSLDDFSGHADLVGPGAPLRLALERDEMWSVVLWDRRARARRAWRGLRRR